MFLVNGKKAEYVGNICMDVCMIDVTGIDDILTDESSETRVFDLQGRQTKASKSGLYIIKKDSETRSKLSFKLLPEYLPDIPHENSAVKVKVIPVYFIVASVVQ